MEHSKYKSIVFIGGIYLDYERDFYKNNSKAALANSSHAHQLGIIKGIQKNNCKVILLNAPFVGTYPKYFRKIIIRAKTYYDCYDIGYINLPVLKQICKTVSFFLKLKSIYHKKQEDLNICVYLAYLPHLFPAYLFKKFHRRTKISMIVPDLPEYFDTTSKKSNFRYFIKIIEQKIIKILLNNIDSCVLITEQMKERLGIGNKPYIVQEGIVDLDDFRRVPIKNNNRNKKIILYSGVLNRQYGIINLLEAFKQINNMSYYLFVCGYGEDAKEINEYRVNDNRVVYFGQLDRENVLKLQSEATVLVNPRTNKGEYTKYSFPFKTMEYLASGRPVIAYKLDGIPDEYDDYIYYIEDNKIETLKNKILEICEKSSSELFEFGSRAREFVLTKKNNIEQAKRLLLLF
jgi:glycosyltransferase involved in cell wall biosynthesis